MNKLLEAFVRGIVESSLLEAEQPVAAELQAGDVISEKEAQHWFKYFHLSPGKFSATFNPRIPTNTPMSKDKNGDTIEDDFTPRISLAPTIMLARMAGALGRELYVGDVKQDASDDFNVIELKQELPNCPPGYPRGKNVGDSLKKMLNRLETDTDPSHANDDDAWEKTVSQPDKSGALSPSKLKEPFKSAFKNCVPATGTSEKWAIQNLPQVNEPGNIGLLHLGTIAGSKRDFNPITLSPEGARFMNIIRQKYGSISRAVDGNVRLHWRHKADAEYNRQNVREIKAKIEFVQNVPQWAIIEFAYPKREKVEVKVKLKQEKGVNFKYFTSRELANPVKGYGSQRYYISYPAYV